MRIKHDCNICESLGHVVGKSNCDSCIRNPIKARVNGHSGIWPGQIPDADKFLLNPAERGLYYHKGRLQFNRLSELTIPQRVKIVTQGSVKKAD